MWVINSEEVRVTKKTRLIALLAVMAVILVAAAVAQQKSDDKAIDPVCGMTVVKASAAATYEYKGARYYFCSTGCKEAFAKDPEKFLNKAASEAEKKDVKEPMAGHMGMHGKMGGQEAGAKAMGCSMSCPLQAEGVEWVVENTPDGAVVKFTSKNPETVKAIQEHLAKMKEMKKVVKK
jgi:YHS domain-containing protein